MPKLDWVGREKVISHDLDVPFMSFDFIKSYENDKVLDKEIDTNNLVIEGDNLFVLKSLLPKYNGKVDCIYIDPPYNTGNEKWIYNDNVNHPQINKWLGQVVGSEGEDLTRHDKWLCMMYPRLKLMQKLLSKDGVLFISIDENEVANLLSISYEIFGFKNVDIFVWQKTDSKVDRNTNAKIINRAKSIHEYILVCYANKSEKRFKKTLRLPIWKQVQKNVFVKINFSVIKSSVFQYRI